MWYQTTRRRPPWFQTGNPLKKKGILGLMIALNRKIIQLSIIFFLIYFGSLFSKGNGKIYTVLIFFILAIYFSKKLSNFINRNTNNKFIKFFV